MCVCARMELANPPHMPWKSQKYAKSSWGQESIQLSSLAKARCCTYPPRLGTQQACFAPPQHLLAYLGSLHLLCLVVHCRALSVYNPRQDEILTLRNGLIAMVVVMAFILSGESSKKCGTRAARRKEAYQ
eukprot:5623-Pelagomonas_calceolata.AAC.4